MLIKVKIRPDSAACKECTELADSCCAVPQCATCTDASGMWVDTVMGAYDMPKAICVLKGGHVVSVPITHITVDEPLQEGVQNDVYKEGC